MARASSGGSGKGGSSRSGSSKAASAKGGAAKGESVKLRLLFVDDGEYHDETVSVPGGGIERYDRLVDFLREDGEVLRHLHVDMARLCAAYRVDD